jgi:hypothetical protein
MDIKINPPDGFAWTSHSLQKGATTTAYAIRVNMQKVKFFGGLATESSVMFNDYIDLTVVSTASDWYFFGWLTPWGGQSRTTHQTATF